MNTHLPCCEDPAIPSYHMVHALLCSCGYHCPGLATGSPTPLSPALLISRLLGSSSGYHCPSLATGSPTPLWSSSPHLTSPRLVAPNSQQHKRKVDTKLCGITSLSLCALLLPSLFPPLQLPMPPQCLRLQARSCSRLETFAFTTV